MVAKWVLAIASDLTKVIAMVPLLFRCNREKLLTLWCGVYACASDLLQVHHNYLKCSAPHGMYLSDISPLGRLQVGQADAVRLRRGVLDSICPAPHDKVSQSPLV